MYKLCISLYIMLCSPHVQLPSVLIHCYYNVIDIFFMLCLLFPWLFHSVTGSMYPPLSFIPFVQHPFVSPLATISLWIFLITTSVSIIEGCLDFLYFHVSVLASGVCQECFPIKLNCWTYWQKVVNIFPFLIC